MPTKVTMPQLGESVEEATITRWLKAVGDPVDEYEPLLEVNTDKVDSEIPSPAAGVVLDIVIPEGTTIHAGAVLAWIGKPGESSTETDSNGDKKPKDRSEEATSVVEEPVSSAAAPAAAPPSAGRDRRLGFISPVVARMAEEHDLDLYQIQGTGRGGRITKNDVLAYLEKRPEIPAQSYPSSDVAPEKTAPPITPPIGKPVAPSTAPISSATMPGELIPLNAVRRAIAEHMVQSKHTSPHVTTVMEVDLSRVVSHREANKTAYARDGIKLTFTPYFIAAAVAALKTHPIVNSSWENDGIRIHRSYNIGMATSLGEEGLIVPVIKNAEQYSLAGLARTVNDLADRARARQLKPDEVKGGTFTITNHGISGSLFATPIINQPQCGILGVGAIQKRVVVVTESGSGDSIAIRPMAYLTLTFDHRILDGATADYFLSRVVETLRNWPENS